VRESKTASAPRWGRSAFVVEGNHSVVSAAISVEGMSYKDARTKQRQDYRDRFDHLTHPATLLLRVVGDPGFRMASSGPENVLVRPARQKPPIRRIQYLFRGRGASVPLPNLTIS
jgi:hypothetical protein